MDNEAYYENHGFYTQYAHANENDTQYLVRLGVNNVDFFGTKIHDYLQSRLTLGVSGNTSERIRMSLYLNTSYNEGQNDRVGGDNSDINVSVETSYRLAERHRLGWLFGISYIDYKKTYAPGQAVNNTEAEDRQEDLYSVGVFYDWFLRNNLQLTARADYREQQSTLDIYDYEKHTGSLALSYYY